MFTTRQILRLALALPFALAAGHAAADVLGGTWTAYNHGCPGGNRTDALSRDVNGRLWVGCGTNAVGYGLFVSSNGGANWQAAPVTPANVFDSFRVSSISRGHDGALYAAGFNASTLEMVLRIDTSVTPHPVTVELLGAPSIGRQFHVGSYRELADGRAIAEALNGTDLLYRPGPDTGTTAATWTLGGLSVQILDMIVYGDAFYGAGSRIVEPPRLFLPPTTPGALPYQFETRELQPANGWEGELWGVAANNRRVVGVGVDQDDDEGKIFVSSNDPYSVANYTELDFSSITGDTRSWGRSACIARNRIVVVGERQPLSSGTGRVLLSNDDGASFTNITPAGVSSSISKCVIEPDGTIVVVGAGGYVGIRQDPDWIYRDEFERN